MEPLMGSDQEVLRNLLHGLNAPLERCAKMVAHEAGLSSSNSLHNLVNQDGRVVPARVLRACMRVAAQVHSGNLGVLAQVASQIAALVGFEGVFQLVLHNPEPNVTAAGLCQHTAEMLDKVAELTKALAKILADGQINSDDGAYVEEFGVNVAVLVSLLFSLKVVLRQETAPTLAGGQR